MRPDLLHDQTGSDWMPEFGVAVHFPYDERRPDHPRGARRGAFNSIKYHKICDGRTWDVAGPNQRQTRDIDDSATGQQRRKDDARLYDDGPLQGIAVRAVHAKP